MPSDLIYREDAKTYARHAMAKGLNVVEYLDEVPAADFRPVVHGKWVHLGSDEWQCSQCGYGIMPWNVGQNFCPNCGVIMDGKA